MKTIEELISDCIETIYLQDAIHKLHKRLGVTDTTNSDLFFGDIEPYDWATAERWHKIRFVLEYLMYELKNYDIDKLANELDNKFNTATL